jgi:hypothetical protein
LTRRGYLALAAITLLVTIMFCGISRDPEFYEPTIFVKHRPTIKIHFFTLTGESDLTLSDLSGESEEEELLYEEFVEGQKIYAYNSDRLWFLPPVLIQLTLTFLVFGTIKQDEIKLKNSMFHFLINVVPTTVMIVLMLFNEGPWQLFGLAMLLLIINFGTTRFTGRKRSAGG